MASINWNVQDFTPGMHSMPSLIQNVDPTLFARKASGVSVNAEGHLRPRMAFRPFGDNVENAITGIVGGRDFIIYLQGDGSLWIFFSNNPEGVAPNEITIESPDVFIRGRLSIIDAFQDFIILKGEGGPPVWVDMRRDKDTFLKAYKLGLDIPDFPQSTRYYKTDDPDLTEAIEDNTLHAFRWTYIRAFGETANQIRDNEGERINRLFSYMESNPSDAWVFARADNARTSAIRTVVDDDGNEYRVAHLGDGYNAIEFLNLEHSPDPQVTGIALYMSEAVPAIGVGTVNVDRLTYRRIAYIGKDEPSIRRNRAATGLDGASSVKDEEYIEFAITSRPLISFENDQMPDTERIFLYNDRIFVANEEGLRYSAFHGTELKLWAFPEVNAIYRPGIVSCIAFRGVLFFGGPTDLYTLTGTTEFNFNVERIGSIGPVSAHAMQVIQNGIVFIGPTGFYQSSPEGSAMVKFSGALDGEFENYQIVNGHCYTLPNEAILFVAHQTSPIYYSRLVTYMYDNGWFQWDDTNIRQVANWRTPDIKVLIADEGKVLQQLLWKRTDLVSDNDDDQEADDLIPWSWESQRITWGNERLKKFKELQIDGQALSMIPQNEIQWDLTRGGQTLKQAYAIKLGTQVLSINDNIFGTSEVSSRVRLTIWIDDAPVQTTVFEMRRDDNRPQRIPINRAGKSIRFQLEGRGHLILRSLTLRAQQRGSKG